MALVHGLSLTDEVLSPQDCTQLERHYLKVLVNHLLRLRQENKRKELIEAVGQIHPTYLPAVINHLSPMAVETCSEDEAMPGQ